MDQHIMVGNYSLNTVFKYISQTILTQIYKKNTFITIEKGLPLYIQENDFSKF